MTRKYNLSSWITFFPLSSLLYHLPKWEMCGFSSCQVLLVRVSTGSMFSPTSRLSLTWSTVGEGYHRYSAPWYPGPTQSLNQDPDSLQSVDVREGSHTTHSPNLTRCGDWPGPGVRSDSGDTDMARITTTLALLSLPQISTQISLLSPQFRGTVNKLFAVTLMLK